MRTKFIPALLCAICGVAILAIMLAAWQTRYLRLPKPEVTNPTATPELVTAEPIGNSELILRVIEPTPEPAQIPPEDVTAIALTLAGEEYEWEPGRKRIIAEIICNRASVNGVSIVDVVSAPGQFAGYWRQSRDISQNDVDVAAEVLTAWYGNGNEPLSELYYFDHINQSLVTASTYDEFIAARNAAKGREVEVGDSDSLSD
jgi:hypothetical protein